MSSSNVMLISILHHLLVFVSVGSRLLRRRQDEPDALVGAMCHLAINVSTYVLAVTLPTLVLALAFAIAALAHTFAVLPTLALGAHAAGLVALAGVA